MIIEKITIKSFGLLTDTTLEFSPTLNVIEGHNEAGKSTIASFIRYMLYGFDGHAEPGAIDERRRRINWDTGRAEGSMIVRVKDKRYLINRSTTMTATVPRPTYKEDSSIIDLETGTTAFGKSPAGEVFFGAQSDLFRNTAYLGAVGDPRIDEDAVKESIENILFSGSEKINIQKAAGKIADKMETLLHKNGQGGTIRDLMYKEEALEQSLVRSDEDNRLILQKEAELHLIRERKRLAEERREKLRDLDDCYRNVMIIRSFDKLHEIESEVEEKTDTYLKFLEEHTKNHYLPDEQYRADLSLARRSVNESYRTLVEASETYSEYRRAVGITKEIEGSIERADTLGGETEIARRAHSLRFSRVQNLALSIVMALLFITSVVMPPARLPPRPSVSDAPSSASVLWPQPFISCSHRQRTCATLPICAPSSRPLPTPTCSVSWSSSARPEVSATPPSPILRPPASPRRPPSKITRTQSVFSPPLSFAGARSLPSRV